MGVQSSLTMNEENYIDLSIINATVTLEKSRIIEIIVELVIKFSF